MLRLQILRENSSTNLLRWMAEAGRSYRIDRSNLPNWFPMATNTAPSDGWLELHVPADGSQGFYRLGTE